MADNPVTAPLLGPSISGTTITVDTYTKTPSRIPQIVRDLVAENEGYFAEEIFATPGFTVEGGALLYQDVLPEYQFLDTAGKPRPRAPGSEATILFGSRGAPKVARPQSWAGRIEVEDEARRRNDVIAVQNAFRQAANTFAQVIQDAALDVLTTFITATSRTVSGGNWRAALTSGVVNADPATLPQRDFALVRKTFTNDKNGVQPDTMIVNPEDAFYLDLIYGDKLPALLQRYGLRMRESVKVSEGDPIFVKAKQVGVLAFEKPLDQEYVREGLRKTDVYVLEATPVPVAYDASAVLQLQNVDS